MIELGVFLPVLSNGWIASTTAPRYRPTYAMNKAMTLLAEDLGFRFVLSPVKYRGMGGPTASATSSDGFGSSGRSMSWALTCAVASTPVVSTACTCSA